MPKVKVSGTQDSARSKSRSLASQNSQEQDAARQAGSSGAHSNGQQPKTGLDNPISTGADPVTGDASRPELAEKVKELVRLAQEQGYLTYNDINEVLPDSMITGEELDEVYVKLRNLEVEIVDQAEVDRVKQPEPEEEEDKTRLDILDDPVRMYLKQMGQVPLLTREQEVEISKRIEDAENEVKNIIYSFGFAGKEHIALAEKLVSEPPKERFDRVILDKKIDSRDAHLRELRRLIGHVRQLDQQVDELYAEWQSSEAKAASPKAH